MIIHAFGQKYLPEIGHDLVKKLVAHHEELGWPGLMGSLDCSHWQWAKCPKSLQGEFKKGSKERPTVVYEGACDSDLFIWHCFFALPGASNDLNVLELSPLMYEIASGNTRVPYSLQETSFDQPYVKTHAVLFFTFTHPSDTFLLTAFIPNGHVS